jgi:hypothetical protein
VIQLPKNPRKAERSPASQPLAERKKPRSKQTRANLLHSVSGRKTQAFCADLQDFQPRLAFPLDRRRSDLGCNQGEEPARKTRDLKSFCLVLGAVRWRESSQSRVRNFFAPQFGGILEQQHFVANNAYGCNGPARGPAYELAKIPVENSGGAATVMQKPSAQQREVDLAPRVWPIYGPVSAHSWLTFGPLLAHYWPTFGPLLAHFWPTFGPLLAHFWPHGSSLPARRDSRAAIRSLPIHPFARLLLPRILKKLPFRQSGSHPLPP